MTTVYTTVSVTDGPPGYVGRHRRRKALTPTTKTLVLLIGFLLIGSVGLTAVVGMWTA